MPVRNLPEPFVQYNTEKCIKLLISNSVEGNISAESST